MVETDNPTAARPAGNLDAIALLKVPSFTPALLAILFSMLAEATGASYIALLAVEKIGMSALELGALLTLTALSGLVATTIFGHMHDRRPVVWPLFLSLAAKTVGFALCAVLTESWMLLLNAAILFGLSSASFALLFAIAKGHLDRVGGVAVSRGMATLRLAVSFSWAIGPALGAGLVALWSFEGVYVGAALLGASALAVALVSRRRVVPVDTIGRAKITLGVVRAAAPAVLALTAFHTAMFMGSNAMSVLVVRELGTETDVGLLFSLCALLEVFVMGAFVIWPTRSMSHGLLFVGFLLFAGYFLMALVWPTLLSLYLGQILRAAGIGIISIVGMAFVQEMLPGRPGIASAVFGNSASAGFLLSGLGTAGFGQVLGYWSVFGASAALCICGGGALLMGQPRGEPQPADADAP